MREGVVQSFALAMQTVFAAAFPVAIGAFVILLFLKELPLRGWSLGERADDLTDAQDGPVVLRPTHAPAPE